jgi:hypothetical protein
MFREGTVTRPVEHSSFDQRLEKSKQQLTRLKEVSFRTFVILLVAGVALLSLDRNRIGIACVALSMLLVLVDSYVTKTRNAVSNAWLRESLRRDSRAPILILRSFDTQGLAFRPPRQVGKARLVGQSYFDEARLASLGPLIAIGTGPRSAQPAVPSDVLSLHTSDGHWPEVFKLASEAAQAILCAPGISKGLVHELSTLVRSKSLAKIVFFMAPTPAKPRGLAAISAKVSPFVDARQVQEKWAELRKFWEARGLPLPEYNPTGQLFVLEDEKGALSSLPLDAGPDLYPNGLAKQIKELLGRMVLSPRCPVSELLQNTYPVEDRTRGTWLYQLLCKPKESPTAR